MKKISDFFGKIKKWSKEHKTLVALLVTALFVTVHVPIMMAHEITTDEGVVWEISKRINLGNMYDVMSVEPHPMLYEFILAPFSQSGLPVVTSSIISLILVSIAVFLFVRFAPMGFLTKLIFILSSCFFYFNSVFSRDYSLAPLAICLVCLAYKNRHEKPLLYGLSLALLSQTHFLMYGFLLVLIVGFVVEEIAKKPGFKKAASSIAKAIIPMALAVCINIPNIIGVVNNHFIVNGGYAETDSIYATDFNVHFIGNTFGLYIKPLEIVLAVYVVIMLIVMYADNRKAMFYLLFSGTYWIVMMRNFYKNYFYMNQKLSILFLICLATIWIIKTEGEKKNVVAKLLNHSELIRLMKKKSMPSVFFVSLIMAMTIPFMVVNIVREFNMKYTSSSEIATVINDNVEDGALIIELDISASTYITSAVYSQITKDLVFYNIPLNTLDDYDMKLRFDGEKQSIYKSFRALTNAEVRNLIDESLKRYEHVYVITASRSGCEKDRPKNEGVFREYEEIAYMNKDEYIKLNNVPLRMYRIR